MNPKVTVLMPVYNGGKYLREAIESVLSQSFREFEFLIVEDGSTDDSVDILESIQDERMRVIHNGRNMGIVDSLLVSRNEIADANQVAAEAYAPAKAESSEKKKLFSSKGVSKMNAASGAGVIRELIQSNSYNSRKELAISLYNNKKYEDAFSVFRRLDNDYPDRDTILYYTAMCNYLLKNFKESIPTFTKLINNPSSTFYQKGKWCFALCLIKASKLNKADSMLRSIIKEESQFSNDAKIKLKALSDSIK